MKPIQFALLIGVSGLLICTTALALDPGTTEEAAARPFMHHRVMFMHDPSTKASVAWTTADEKLSSHHVYYDTIPRNGDLEAYAFHTEDVRSHRYTIKETGKGVPNNIGHSVLLEDLEPATTYYLAVKSGEHVSRELHFVTAPADHRSVKLLFGGDSRRPPSLPAVHEDRRSINRFMAGLLEEHPDIVALAHGGDYCTRAEWVFMTDWLSDHELTTTEAGRLLPIIPARGNHDHGTTFEEMFYWPEKHDYHFATELSAGVVLLTLNTEISHGGDQRDWLEKTLKAHRKEDRGWILAQYHRPAYGSVKSFSQGASQRQNWVPLFEEFEVNLVMEADHHSLKRTVPIYQDQADSEKGIIYIGDGGLGVPQRDPDPTRWYLQEPGLVGKAHHVHLISLSEDKMKVVALGLDGERLDEFEVRHRTNPVTADREEASSRP